MKNILSVALLLISFYANSQVLQPVKWNTKSKKISKNEFEIIFTANINHGWHIYSVNIPENGPTPTDFSFEKSNDYYLIGNIKENKGIIHYDNTFNMNIEFFKEIAIFKQRIKIIDKEKVIITGVVNFSVCDDGRCINDYHDFEIEI